MLGGIKGHLETLNMGIFFLPIKYRIAGNFRTPANGDI